MNHVNNHQPNYCVWELTTACNQRCGHCGSKAGDPRRDEMTTDECLETVRSLAKLGCEVITLSGGEPTLRTDWFDITREIRHQGMIPNMVSNGFAMDAHLAGMMKESGLVNVAISIDGPRDVHEQIRGKGSFDRTVGAIELLGQVEMPVTVMTTINTLNIHRLDEVYKIACDLNVDRWRCQLGKAMGHMKANSDLVIKPKDLLILLPKLYALDQKGPVSVGIGDSIGFYGPYDTHLRAVSWKGTQQRWSGCQAGMRAIGIESNGGIKGCLSLQAFRGENDMFLEGNVRDRSLESIWNDPSGFAYNRQFVENNLTGACRKCSHRSVCRGGAKCVASTSTGGVSENPYCYIRVSNAATRWPRIARNTAAAASFAALLGTTGCRVVIDEEPPPTNNNGKPTCEEVCCECEYGVIPDEVWSECCVQADYGVEPTCEDVDCSDPGLPLDVAAECCPAPEYGVEPVCEDVDCSDARLPQDVATECCPAPEYGVEPTKCEEVCCECEYGVIPEDVYQECCTEPVNCEEVCCDCDYGILPEEEYNQCCKDPQGNN